MELLREVAEASGVSRTEIIEACVKAHASDYVRYVFEKRQAALDDFLKTSKGKKQ